MTAVLSSSQCIIRKLYQHLSQGTTLIPLCSLISFHTLNWSPNLVCSNIYLSVLNLPPSFPQRLPLPKTCLTLFSWINDRTNAICSHSKTQVQLVLSPRSLLQQTVFYSTPFLQHFMILVETQIATLR